MPRRSTEQGSAARADAFSRDDMDSPVESKNSIRGREDHSSYPLIHWIDSLLHFRNSTDLPGLVLDGDRLPGRRCGTGRGSGSGDWATRCCGRSGTGASLYRNLTANHAGYAAGLGVGHLTGHAAGYGAGRLVAFLAAGRVGHLASDRFTSVGAGRVRNLAGHGFAGVAASRVRNLTGDALSFHPAGGVGDAASDAFFHVAAGRVRNLASPAFTHHGAGGVGNSLGRRHGDLRASRVGNLSSLRFANPAGAANLALFDFRAPGPTAAGRAGALDLNLAAAAGLVAAAAGAGIQFPCSRILHALGHDGTRYMVGFCLPFAGANFDRLRFMHGTTHGAADSAVASLRLSLPRGAAHIAVAGVIHRSADRVVARAVASVVNRAADRLGAFAVAGLVDRPANGLRAFAIASRVDRPTHCLGAFAIAGLIDRPANRAADVAIVRLVHIAGTGHRDLFAALVEDRLAARDFLFVPDNLTDRAVGLAAHFRLTIIAARSARG